LNFLSCSLVFFLAMLKKIFVLAASLTFLVATVSAADAKVRIALAGDSTVTTNAGWGLAFEKLLGPNTECIQLARGGQSSKSYRDSGNWKKVLDAKPNYILIQFGHNDMPGKGENRETDPKTTFPENLGRFVEEARAIGAVPILVTSMARRTYDKEKIRGELAPWAEATRKVGKEKNVAVVDLFARSVELLEKMGPKEAVVFDPVTKDGKPDHTHLSPKGAEIMAKVIADEIRKVKPDLAKSFEK
jgi:lysophospholipase L1-like esterase